MSNTARNALLNIINLTVSIEDRTLCKSLSVTMSVGESWSILGPNGSGKTTLLETIAGLRPARSGEVLIAGEKVSSFSSRQLASQRSILFQKTDDAFPATVLETVLSGRHPHIPYWQAETDVDYEIARESLNRVDLVGFEERDINNLSGGERQRVSIAACLAQNTPIRLFDEPANHLDLKHQKSILELITNKRECLNLLVLQDINQAWRFSSHALLVHPNGTTETGTVEKVLTSEKLSTLYACKLRQLEEGKDRIFIQD
jgi:iron complex transport system ATP-binding protein